MAHLTGLGLQNFRVFKDLVFFDFAPITVLTGTNNSGKSSVFKALLLLYENTKTNNFFNWLSLNTNEVSLGTAEYIRTESSNSEIIEITLKCKIKPTFKQIYENPNQVQHFTENDELKMIIQSVDLEEERQKTNEIKIESLFYLKMSLNCINGYESLGVRNLELFDNKKELLFSYKKQDGHNIRSILDINVQKILNDFIERKEKDYIKSPINYNNRIKNLTRSVFDTQKLNKTLGSLENKDKFIDRINYNLLYIARFGTDDINGYYRPTYYQEKDLHDDIFEVLNSNRACGYLIYIEDLFDNRYYRFTTFDDSVLESQKNEFKQYLDICGKFDLREYLDKNFRFFLYDFLPRQLELILKSFKKSINYSFIESVRANSQRLYTNQSQGTGFNSLLLQNKYNLSGDFINHWIREFGIADEIKFERIKGVATVITLRKNDKWSDLADFGYGVTQFLPILLKIYTQFEYIDDNKIDNTPKYLLIEEPETNLHPKLQSKIADMLVDALITFDIQFIIETHSEYFIRKLQYLVAKKEIKSKDVALYYLYEADKVPEGEKQVKKLDILPDGSLSDDFGEGFFDEATKWKFELLKLKNQN